MLMNKETDGKCIGQKRKIRERREMKVVADENKRMDRKI